ncbi:MAG: hypothetical protein HY828_03135 [Actinobacteria bacterium]|nr:hypothetical protein [Actinomycetota bacterium]
MTTPQHTGWFSGRTRVITIVSLLAVGAAGAIAVSANLGVSNAAPATGVGNVTAADLTTPNTQVIDVYLPSTTAAAMTAAGTQEFTVDVAGTVAVAATEAGIRLDRVSPAAGWTWTLTQSSAQQLTVSLTNGTRTLEFVATLNADGTVGAAVNEPIVTAAPASGTNGGGGYESDDDSHEGGDDDD